MTVATEISRISTAKANIKTAIENHSVTVPSDALIDTYPTYINKIGESTYWTSNWQFKRPSDWPDIDTLWTNSSGYVWFIGTFDCRPRIANPKRTDGICVYRGGGSNTATIERLKLVSGEWVVANTGSLTANGKYSELLPTDEGDFVVYRVTFGSANAQYYWKLQNGNTGKVTFDGVRGTDNNYYYTTTCVEMIVDSRRCMHHPYPRSPLLRRYEVKNFKNYGSSYGFNSTHLRYCSSLEYLGLDFDTTNGAMNMTSLERVFDGMSMLRKLNLANWTTANVTTMAYCFNKCYCLESLNVSSWNTAKVTTFAQTFYGCSSLKTLDVSTWSTTAATTLTYMFAYCTNLETISLAAANTSKVTNFSYMFSNCFNLKTLTLGNSFSMAAATTLSYMFQYCQSMMNCPLSGKTLASGSVTAYTSMFHYCISLTEMDMSGWDLSGVTDANNVQNVFAYCYSLKKVVLPSSIKVMKNTYFDYCYNLEIIIVNATTPPTWAATSTYLGRLHPNYKIYVPDASVNSYKSASGWTNASSHIFSIDDLT